MYGTKDHIYINNYNILCIQSGGIYTARVHLAGSKPADDLYVCFSV